MKSFTEQYHELLENILNHGHMQNDPNRKGVQRLQIPFYDITVDLEQSFPAITTKDLYYKGVVEELLWFLRGDTDAKNLSDKGVHIWDADAERWGSTDLGRIYGAQWRRWKNIRPVDNIHPLMTSDFPVDQILKLIDEIRSNPLSSKLLVTAWNPAEINEGALPPCHYSFQISNTLTGHGYYEMSLIFNMRSSDVFLGLPFNMASYATLLVILSYFCSGQRDKFFPKYVKYSGTNVHLYDNQLKATENMIGRDMNLYREPTLQINFEGHRYLDEWLKEVKYEHFRLIDYRRYPPIKDIEMLTYTN